MLHIPLEYYYHTIFHCILKAFSIKVKSEVSESGGILDLKVTFPGNRIFVIEFKYKKIDETEKIDKIEEEKPKEIKGKKVSKASIQKLLTEAIKEAKEQIESRGYDEKYISEGKEVHKVAIAIVGRTEVAVEIY
jgi:hypothetical protein